MKREELKEWIELYFEDFMSPLAVEYSTNQFMEKIDEYTKPKTKKNINGDTRLRNKDRREAKKL